MRKLIIITLSMGCLLILSGLDTLAQVPFQDPRFDPGPMVPSVTWQARYSSDVPFGIDRAVSMALHPDGTVVYLVGESQGPFGGLDYTTLAYDTADGDSGPDLGRDPLWEIRYDPLWHRNDVPTQVQVSPDGNLVFVTGTSIGSGADGEGSEGIGDADWDFVTVAYDARSGVEIWRQRYHGHQRGDGWTNSMAIAPDSSTVLINGRSNCAEPGNATIAYDALTGEELWIACFEDCLGYEDFGTQLAVSGDNRTVIVAGTRRNHVTGYDIATIAFDLATGQREWVRYYDNGLYDPDAFPQEPLVPGTDPTFDSPRAIAVDPAGGSAVYVTGVSRGHYGLVDYVTLVYDAGTGAKKGEARFDGDLPGNDRANAIAVSPDGSRVFVTGESQTPSLGREVVTIAYDWGLRNRLWVVHHNTSETDFSTPDGRDDIARLIDVSDDGQTVTVAGDSWGSNKLDWMFVQYDATTGERQWSGLYDGLLSHADFFRGLAVNGDASRVFLMGHSCSCGTTGMDILTMGIRVDESEAMTAPMPWSSPRRGSRHFREAGRHR